MSGPDFKNLKIKTRDHESNCLLSLWEGKIMQNKNAIDLIL